MSNDEHKKDKRMTRGVVVLYLVLTLGLGTAIVANTVKIQFVQGDMWRELGNKRESILQTNSARRGNIYSSDGKILATTVTECYLYLDLLDTIVLDNKGKPRLNKKGEPLESGIPDSSFHRYLDTVSLLLHEAVPMYPADHYRNRIALERAKENPSRCFAVLRSPKGYPLSIPYSTWLTIKRLPGWGRGVVAKVDGQSVQRQVRAHIYGNLAGNTIGFENNKHNFTGLEGYYDSILRGQDGIALCRRLTKGIWLPDEPRERKEIPQRTDGDKVDTIVVQNKVDGRDIVSTIDTRYQDIAESSLRKALRRYGGTAGCAILMEMETGYVLACANLAVDTLRHDYREVRDRNVAVSDVYEPGSTFKTVILTAMLEDSQVKIDTSLRVPARYKNFGGVNGEIKDDHGDWDSLSLKRVIEQSSNVGMCDLGWQLYSTRRDTLRHLVEGMFPYANINPDVKAREYRSYINDLHQSKRDFLNFCYGYSTRVSPLQLITFYNALGAGGRMVKPLFCRAVVDENGRQREVKPVVLNPSICSRSTARLMSELLENVVENGTGNNIKNNTYGIAGKTGTSVFSYSNRKRYNASFAGFFPSENPRYTCLVVVEDIPYFGRQAAEVFKSIADCVVAIDKRLSDGGVKSVWPTLEEDSAKALQRPTVAKGDQTYLADIYKLLRVPYRTADPDSRWVSYQPATDSTQATYIPYAPVEGKVPNCYGMTAKDAVELLQSMGYRARVRGYGRVFNQSVKGQAAQGTTVVLTMK